MMMIEERKNKGLHFYGNCSIMIYTDTIILNKQNISLYCLEYLIMT